MSDILVTQATVKEIGVRNINATEVVTLKTDKGSFQFWENKQDGTQTKAYGQYKKFRFSTGDSVEIHYSERPAKEINPHTGQPYMNRSVLFFGETNNIPDASPRAPQPAAPAANPQVDNASILGRLSTLESQMQTLLGAQAAKVHVPYTPPSYKPYSTQSAAQVPDSEIPTINMDDELDEIRLEDVPF